jgi:oxalate decarboxylase
MNRKEFLVATGAALTGLAVLPQTLAQSAPSASGKSKGDGAWKKSGHKFRLEKDGKVAVDDKGGTIRIMNGQLAPGLTGMTMYAVHMKPGGLREPHWHPNASELNYVIGGKVRIGILHADGTPETFELEAGDTGFIPKGWFHYIENINDGDSHVIVGFDNVNPEDVGISGAIGFLSNNMLATTFGVPAKTFESIPKSTTSILMAPK